LHDGVAHDGTGAGPPPAIGGLLQRMTALLDELTADDDPRRFFLATYRRTTVAVAERLERGDFDDPAWVERWDVVFADLYLDALRSWSEQAATPEPWRVAFGTARAGVRLPPLRHVLLGMNAHVNYDLPQSLLAVVDDDEFADEAVLARRERDHRAIDEVLASRVAAEDVELRKVEQPGDRTRLDRALQPLNRLGTRRFLTEARRKVWRNARVLSTARRQGRLPDRLAELERLSADRVQDLTAPGQVLLRLARDGFGVELPRR
jgi:hypothetical protein